MKTITPIFLVLLIVIYSCSKDEKETDEVPTEMVAP